MLPASFDIKRISSPALRKVAQTLKSYGAYVVDRNYGTPYAIYVESGTDYNLHGAKWNSTVASELVLIQQQLRQVVSAGGWVNGNGQFFRLNTNLNMLSMRGPWVLSSGNGTASFDTWRQALSLSASTLPTTVAHYNNRSIAKLNWAQPVPGKNYTFTAVTTAGATVKLSVIDKDLNKTVFSTGFLSNGSTVTFPWPAKNYSTALYVTGVAGQASTASATLLEAVPVR
jgi:hypothetical protein